MQEEIYDGGKKIPGGITNTHIKIPKNVRQIGSTGGEFTIYIEDYVRAFLQKQHSNDYSEFYFAILTGVYRRTESECCLFIRGALKLGNLLEGDRISFTEKTWTSIYEEIRIYFPEQEAVGWYVGGINFSNDRMEMITHAHADNFAGKGRVLLLHDLLEKEEVFYHYEKKKLYAQTGYFIYYAKNEEMQHYMLDIASKVEAGGENENRDEKEGLDKKSISQLKRNATQNSGSKKSKKKKKERTLSAARNIEKDALTKVPTEEKELAGQKIAPEPEVVWENDISEDDTAPKEDKKILQLDNHLMKKNLLIENQKKPAAKEKPKEPGRKMVINLGYAAAALVLISLFMAGSALLDRKDSNQANGDLNQSVEPAGNFFSQKTTTANLQDKTIMTTIGFEKSSKSEDDMIKQTKEETQGDDKKSGDILDAKEEDPKESEANIIEPTTEADERQTEKETQKQTEESSDIQDEKQTEAGSREPTDNEVKNTDNAEESDIEANATVANTYLIQKGDTLFSISRKFFGDMSYVKAIKVMNEIQDENIIEAGKTIKLPKK